ncbi:MAG: hypothetical protein VB131_04940 [Burkholderia gladioli]
MPMQLQIRTGFRALSVLLTSAIMLAVAVAVCAGLNLNVSASLRARFIATMIFITLLNLYDVRPLKSWRVFGATAIGGVVFCIIAELVVDVFMAS